MLPRPELQDVLPLVIPFCCGSDPCRFGRDRTYTDYSVIYGFNRFFRFRSLYARQQNGRPRRAAFQDLSVSLFLVCTAPSALAQCNGPTGARLIRVEVRFKLPRIRYSNCSQR
jgi:hypothetical protein